MRGRRSSLSSKTPPAPKRLVNRCRTVLVIDNRPLQAAAWADLRRARRVLEKATRAIHTHEEKDEPAFRSWIATALHPLLSAVRELAQQVETKGRLIDAVERESYASGRPAGQIWRDWEKSGGPAPGDFPEDDDPATSDPFQESDDDDDDSFPEAFSEAEGDFPKARGGRQESDSATEARTIYRRLVQHLHPDRGGAWTPIRARLWEQMQAAWASRDADWLARLEVEWEAGADRLGPDSALGRLRAATSAINAAHRDAERRLGLYRQQEAWHFSRRAPSAALKRQVERQLKFDEIMLRRQLRELEHTLTRWSRTRARRRANQPRSRSSEL